MKSMTRRDLLKGSAVVGGAALLSFNKVFGFSRVFGQEMADDDLETIINLAATAELFATTHYLAAINGAADLGFSEAETAYAKAAFLAEQDHLELLQSLGAAPVVTEFYVPETLFSDRALFAATTEVAETAFIGAYLAAVRIFGQSADTVAFAVTTAQIAGVEEVHRSFVRGLGLKLGNHNAYLPYTVNNVSEVVPTLQPFLDGSGEGFIGPVPPPTADQIAAIRAEAEQLGYDNPFQPYAALAAE